tara:strand:+ start:198 stop:1229 length:1032 start_codon:yes stop_codon:yes gene_type:complete
MVNMRPKLPVHTPLAQTDALRKRMENIRKRISATPRGQQMLDWADGHKITMMFSESFSGFAEYSNQDAPDKDGNIPEPQPRSEISGGLLELNADIHDDQLIIGIFDQLRHAWHEKVARSAAPNPSVPSRILTSRFEQADATSFVACMAMEMIITARDPGPLNAFMQIEDFTPFFESMDCTTRIYGFHFEAMRRQLFEEMATTRNAVNLAAQEIWQTRQILDYLKDGLKGSIEDSVKLTTQWNNAKTSGTAPTLDLSAPVHRTIGFQDYLYYGNTGFAQDGPNYLTDIGGVIDFDAVTWIAPAAIKLMQEFEAENKAFQNRDLSRQPNKKGAPAFKQKAPTPKP